MKLNQLNLMKEWGIYGPAGRYELNSFGLLSSYFQQLSKSLSKQQFSSQPLGSLNTYISTDTGLTSSITPNLVTKDATLGLSGTALSGSSVTVYDGAKFLGYATQKGTAWSFTTPTLADGTHNLKVVISSGNKTESFGVSTVVDTVASGTFSSQIITDSGSTKSIASNGTTKDHTLGFSGTSESGSVVKIYDGSKLLGQTVADYKGQWVFTTPNLSDGYHKFSARFIDIAGNEKDVAGISANLVSTWSAESGWGSIDVLAAINVGTGKTLADVKAPEGTQWGFNSANINDAWTYGYTGKGITIAVIDTGIDLNNTDIASNISKSSWNFVNNTSDVMDDNGHGTFVASEMTAANNGVGLTGASYDSYLMVLKALDEYGGGSAATACTAIKYAVDHGANIINMSLGGGAYSGYATALQYAKDHNVLVVMAAGNNAGASPVDPAAYAKQFDNCLAVGALQSDAKGAVSMTSFSNRAGSENSYGFVDAAGRNVIGYTVGGEIASWAGTSMAAPLVASAAALVWSSDPTATAAQIVQTLSQTSHALL